MLTSRIAFAFAAVLTASAAVPVVYADPAPAAQPGDMRGFLTPQQRAILMMENGSQWQSMSDTDRHAARDKMRAQWTAMSQSDREAKRTALQAKWDALPQAQKDQLTDRMQQWAAHRSQNNNGGQ